MSRFTPADIVMELKELCQELVVDIRQQLNYYRASVYKDEMATQIRARIEKLRVISALVPCELIKESLHDYDATLATAGQLTAPGECSFTARILRLLHSVEAALAQFGDIQNASVQNPVFQRNITRSVQKHRRDILSACRHGSRQWAFFQTI